MEPLSAPYAALAGLDAALDRVSSGRARSLVLLAGGLAFFAAPIVARPDEPLATRALPLATFLAALACTVAGVRSQRTAPWIVALVALLATFKVLAASWAARDAMGVAVLAIPIGVSYYVLRGISALVDVSRRGRGADSLEVAGYLAFVPILSLGPIERLGTFLAQRKPDARAGRLGEDLQQATLRIVEGAFKILVLAEAFRGAAAPFHRGEATWVSVYASLLHLWLDFSGATDLAIGAARLFGVKVMENFDLPFSRPSLAEFWRSWHISLSSWLRDYLFFPIAKRLPAGSAPFVAPFLVMSLCGLWHGLTLPFFVWGLTQGAGLAAHQ
ncbi:MAG TPA: MBOAT family O-acyltransferase, partial [Planctomycetota bacterium]|nr:MBOAT family O-acyltransferase [Planctomycetota bacterium]